MMQKSYDISALLRPRLDVRHLSLLVAIAETGSVTRAAELLGISQPALSRQVREAERRLGRPLYDRDKKRLRPTLVGDCLLENARRILRDLNQAEADSIQLPAGPRLAVRIGSGAYSSYGWLPGFTEALSQGAPSLELAVSGATTALPQDALLHEDLDLAIVPGPIDGRGLMAVPLFDDELIAVFPKCHRLAVKPVVSAEDFADQTYLTYGPTYQKGFETDRVLRPAKVWPQKLVKVELVDAIIDLVAADMGVSVLSRWAVAAHRSYGALALARVTGAGLPIRWSAVIRRADGERSPAVALARELARWCRSSPEAFSSRSVAA